MNDISNTLIPLIFIIVVVIIISLVFYLLAISNFNKVNTGLISQCPPGQCATNIQSGFKRCPTTTSGSSTTESGVTVQLSTEVCNSQFACDNNITPFAVQSDGSTNIFGVCPENVPCQCLKNAQCAEYILSVFNSKNGNAYGPNNNPDNVSAFGGQRISFPQTTTSVIQSGSSMSPSSVVSDQTPLSFNNPGTNFCSIPASWLPFVGCGFITSNQVTLEDIQICMAGGPPGSENSFAVCNQGVLAFVTNDSANIDINTTQLSCVRGMQCPSGQLNVYDTNLGGIVCK